ncbi:MULTISPECIES: hypothetical protein [unclassified Frondihabitans]|uniref:hypothetical protein n=1 Tax=unclassified Frondihabitans TaxID=2626248 RepID=UPI000F50B311|nr:MULTISPECIES: hypothetical protein [unclassified Frondihabitans]RPE75239.1 hypothetical protein EDF37_2845 [Frondihabitans sp. PhB153]RPF04481.1 hypothetical protein EDF39_2913 [Frondihabitans sp. PhB161]
MNYESLRTSIASLGFYPHSVVTTVNAVAGQTATAGPSYSLVHCRDGFTVMADGGRDDVYEKPFAGHRFATEGDAIAYLWRQIRWSRDPALLTDVERAIMQREDEETLRRMVQDVPPDPTTT